ncbi:helicase-associated domain-containing protein [Gulosibacter sp. 10]|uniref:helicase-associated domain-containing protein n=1 Tax=Gulosibacter sp. 10 TaxID=1255570 RepID=UPI00097EE1ED|nr:helicase-associated domain-containing protein [Gulosibacter sp. 10]SJM71724.1 probable DNA-binding protein [Gulosibacter sp. 10]
MPPVPDSLRILASLRSLDEDGFARLLRARRVQARGMEDLLDLAEWLESPANIASALERLDWPTLRGLRTGAPEALAHAAALQLAVVEDPEAGTVALLPEASRQLDALLPEPPAWDDAELAAEAAGTEAAHAATQLANDALWLIAAESRAVHHARERLRLSGVELRRIAAELDRDPHIVDSTYRWLFEAGLIAPSQEVWRLTERGHGFLIRPVAERWRALVETWLGELRLDGVRALAESAGVRLAAGALPEAEGESVLADAEALGMLDRGALTPLGARALDDDLDGAVGILAAHLPAPVEQVYVQPDQSILAPGPLEGELDLRLRRVARLENRAMASEYRLTPASVTRALNAGMTEDEIRALLAEVSLTGIPQPVDYLIGSTAAQHGRVRVRAHDTGSGISTRVRAESEELRDAIEVDTALGTLGLQRAGEELSTRLPPRVALAALLDARYPAVLEDAEHRLVPEPFEETAEPHVPLATPTAMRAAAELAGQAAEGDHADDRITWLQRRLELARRNKAEVRVRIDVPGKEAVTLALVPVAVNTQRLRAIDLDADVERTVPTRAILSIEE